MPVALKQSVKSAFFIKQQKVGINLNKIINMARNMAREYKPFVNADEDDFEREIRQITYLAVLEALKSFDPSKRTDFTSWTYFYLRNAMNSTFTNGGRVITTEVAVCAEDMQAIFRILGIKPVSAVVISFSEKNRDDMQKLRRLNTFLKEHCGVVITSKRFEISGNRLKGCFKKYIKPVSLEALREDNGFEIADGNADANESFLSLLPGQIDQTEVLRCLKKNIEKLPILHKKIILKLYGLFGCRQKNYKELAGELGLTEQRIRQMEKEILSFLQKKVISSFSTK